MYYSEGKIYNGSFEPLFSERKYIIKNGVLYGIVGKKEDSLIFIKKANCTQPEVYTNGEHPLFQKLIELSKVPITGNKKEFPEYFYLMIDEYSKEWYRDIEISDAIVKNDTDILVDDMIEEGKSFFKTLDELNDTSFLNNNNFLKAIENKSKDEILELKNRYTTNIDYTAMLNIEELDDILKEERDIIDELQTVENDDIQEIVKQSYIKIDSIREMLKNYK